MLIVHNRHFRRSVAQGFDNLFKHTGNLIVIGGIPALGADVGRNVLDDNDVISEVNHERGFFLLKRSFYHKSSSLCFLLSCLSVGFPTFGIWIIGGDEMKGIDADAYVLSGLIVPFNELYFWWIQFVF